MARRTVTIYCCDFCKKSGEKPTYECYVPGSIGKYDLCADCKEKLANIVKSEFGHISDNFGEITVSRGRMMREDDERR